MLYGTLGAQARAMICCGTNLVVSITRGLLCQDMAIWIHGWEKTAIEMFILGSNGM